MLQIQPKDTARLVRTHTEPRVPRDPECQDEVAALSQTPPFRYLDEVLSEPSAATSILGWVRFEDADDRLYDPALSGSFLLEALAQLSSVLLRRHTGVRRGGVLAGIERAEFDSEPPGRGGILLIAQVRQSAFPHFSLSCSARQRGRVLCSCTLSTRINDGADQ